MPNNNIPDWLKPYISDDAYIATKEQIEDLDPQSREDTLLKYIALNLGNNGTLIITVNGKTPTTYNGEQNASLNLEIPVITYGTGSPSGGDNGDVYMRYA